MKRKYVIYARSATQPENGERSNIDNQITNLIRFAQKSDLEIVDVISEFGGGLFNNRHSLMKMLANIEDNNVEGILCTSWDRLTRNIYTHCELKKIFQRNDIKIMTLNTPGNDLHLSDIFEKRYKCYACEKKF